MSSELYKDRLSVTILGGGSFGTVLADICATNGHKVTHWMRSLEQIKEVNSFHTNTRYLPDFTVHSSVKAVHDIGCAVEDTDLIFVAIPSQSLREVVSVLKGKIRGKAVVSTSKGIEPSTFKLMSEVIEDELPECKAGVLSGPNLAHEILKKSLTASVVASLHDNVRVLVQQALQCSYFRVYTSNDPYGVQLGGALKNIYAIAAGIATAMGMGENTRAMFITRSLAEMSRFAVMMGANPITFLGLSGVGDLIVTCSSTLSRNFRLGMELGKGLPLSEAEKIIGQVAEGVNTLKLVNNKAEEKNIYMPITSGLYRVVFEGKSIKNMIHKGMLSEGKYDVEFSFRSD